MMPSFVDLDLLSSCIIVESWVAYISWATLCLPPITNLHDRTLILSLLFWEELGVAQFVYGGFGSGGSERLRFFF